MTRIPSEEDEDEDDESFDHGYSARKGSPYQKGNFIKLLILVRSFCQKLRDYADPHLQATLCSSWRGEMWIIRGLLQDPNILLRNNVGGVKLMTGSMIANKRSV